VATPSIRRNALTQLVAVLAAVTAGATYYNTLTGTGQVALASDSDDARLAKFALTMRVTDGVERHVRSFASPRDGNTETTLELVVDVLLRRTATGSIVNQMADAIHDISLALGLNPTLNGAVNDARIREVDGPIYDTENNLAAALVRLEVIYDYQPGVTS